MGGTELPRDVTRVLFGYKTQSARRPEMPSSRWRSKGGAIVGTGRDTAYRDLAEHPWIEVLRAGDIPGYLSQE